MHRWEVMCIAITFLVIQSDTFGQDLDKMQKEIEKQRETNRIKTRIIKALQSNGIKQPDLGQTDVQEGGPTIKHIPKPPEDVETTTEEAEPEPVLLVIGEPACKYS